MTTGSVQPRVSTSPLCGQLFLLLVLLCPNWAQAVEVEQVSEATFGASVFRLGAQADLRTGLHVPLFERENQALFQGTGLKAVATINATPANARLGGRVTFTPLAIFDFHLHGGVDGYFGNFQTLVGYEKGGSVYGSNAEIAEYVEATGNRAPGHGYHGGAQAVLKAKAGPVILLASAEWVYWNIQADVEGDWFFERELEHMLRFGGDVSENYNLLLLFEQALENTRRIRVGSFSTMRRAVSASDALVRSGLLLSIGNDQRSHNLVVQPYIFSRYHHLKNPPYVAYAFKIQN